MTKRRIQAAPAGKTVAQSGMLVCQVGNSNKDYQAFVNYDAAADRYITWVAFGRIGAKKQMWQYYDGTNINTAVSVARDCTDSKLYPKGSKDKYSWQNPQEQAITTKDVQSGVNELLNPTLTTEQTLAALSKLNEAPDPATELERDLQFEEDLYRALGG